MEKQRSKRSIGTKLYIFIILTVLSVAIVVALLSYQINANQIDRYYKQVTYDSAVTFSAFVDGDYLAKLRAAAESEEFQELREKAEEMNREIAAGHTDIGVVMIDINDLKMINDKYGHKSGDLYIQGCCHMICEVFRHSPVYRIGGDEFVVILQGVDFDARYNLVNELKSSYAKTQVAPDAEAWERFSAAVGMAEHASDDLTMDLIFKRADKAMYEDKQQYKSQHGSYR